VGGQSRGWGGSGEEAGQAVMRGSGGKAKQGIRAAVRSRGNGG
jgi:hypothetical protein